MSNKRCTKCDTYMSYEDGVYTCETCLRELVNVKRKMWESESKIVDISDDNTSAKVDNNSKAMLLYLNAEGLNANNSR